jgi:hypothetical protein
MGSKNNKQQSSRGRQQAKTVFLLVFINGIQLEPLIGWHVWAGIDIFNNLAQ